MSHRRPQAGTRSYPRVLAILVAVAALLVGSATVAQAHDVLVSTSPADRSSTAVVPAQVTLTFAEPALAIGTDIVVTGPSGQVQSGTPVLVDNTVAEHLRPGSPAGRYTVTWRVTSTDGHTVSGRLSFTARAPSPAQQATATTSTSPRPRHPPALLAPALPAPRTTPSLPARAAPATPAGTQPPSGGPSAELAHSCCWWCSWSPADPAPPPMTNGTPSPKP